MDGWTWPSVSKEDVATNAGVIVSNYLMARTRQIELWNAKTYQRARQWTSWSQSVCFHMYNTLISTFSIDLPLEKS
jgi:hypothetical protein